MTFDLWLGLGLFTSVTRVDFFIESGRGGGVCVCVCVYGLQ